MASLTVDNSGLLQEPLANVALGNSTSIITPTALSGSVNDYNPTGLSQATVIRLSLGAARNMTGIVAQANGKLLLIQNIDSTFDLTLKHQSGSSAAGNKINGGNAADVVVRHLGSCLLWYDGIQACWQTVAI